jgi:hypothetical protein
MPIVNDEQLRSLLAAGHVNALTLDTNIFDQKRLQLNSSTLQALTRLKELPYSFILTDTVFNEVLAHIHKALEEAYRSAKKELGAALFAFETKRPTRAELLELVTGGKSIEIAARDRLNSYVEATGCEILEDTKLVDVATIFSGYFSGRPPFGPGRKKSEFPDSLALNALEVTARMRERAIMVVSQDGDWRSYCENSDWLYLVPTIESALNLVTNAPLKLRRSVFNWIGTEGEGREEIVASIRRQVESMDFDVSAHPSTGELEAFAWAGEFQSVDWPEDNDISVIDVEQLGDNEHQVTVSLPLRLDVRVPIELNFSFWDSIDRESVGMGSRTIDRDEELFVRMTVTLDVKNAGTQDETIELNDSDLDLRRHEIELGDVDVFEQEDVWPDDDHEPA